jgi:ATP-dependent Clp protease protease subunit
MLNVSGADLFLYDVIGPSELGMISAMDVIDALGPMEGKDINLRIMSYGGSVDQGVAIYNAIRRRRGKTKVYIDSIAASIASVIAMAGDEIIMNKGSKMMIHDPWTIAVGNSMQMRKMADQLDTYADGILDIYVQRSKRPKSEVQEMMRAETWMTAEQAIALGFADITEESEAQAIVVPSNMFRNVPVDVLQVDIKSTRRLDQAKLAVRVQEIMRRSAL